MDDFYKGFKAYCKRKHYQRIDRSGSRRSKSVEPGNVGSSSRRKRFWRIKITPKLRFFNLRSTKKFFIRLRDSYVNMMLGVASSKGLTSGFGGGGGGGFKREPLKEYDEKIIIEIYKKIVAQGQLVPRSAGNVSAPGVVHVCRP